MVAGSKQVASPTATEAFEAVAGICSEFDSDFAVCSRCTVTGFGRGSGTAGGPALAEGFDFGLGSEVIKAGRQIKPPDCFLDFGVATSFFPASGLAMAVLDGAATSFFPVSGLAMAVFGVATSFFSAFGLAALGCAATRAARCCSACACNFSQSLDAVSMFFNKFLSLYGDG
ncbi:hypothetical protein HDK64DRAFT_281870 [Phyllosticta capitalensis]